MLKVESVCHEINARSVLNDISFTLNPGELLHIQGPNGAGKSTLLRLLAGLMQPTSGSIKAEQQLAYLGHKNAVKSLLTVAEQLGILDVNIIKNIGLHGILNVESRYLSAGQKQRVALARVFSSNAKLWLLDEPFTSLDSATKTVAMEYLGKHLNAGGMVVMSSHDNINIPGQMLRQLHLEGAEA